MGHGGIEYVPELFGVDPNTIHRGIADFENHEDHAPDRTRKKVAVGRTWLMATLLEEKFLKILAEFTAGDPMREGVLWSHLSRCTIVGGSALRPQTAVEARPCCGQKNTTRLSIRGSVAEDAIRVRICLGPGRSAGAWRRIRHQGADLAWGPVDPRERGGG